MNDREARLAEIRHGLERWYTTFGAELVSWLLAQVEVRDSQEGVPHADPPGDANLAQSLVHQTLSLLSLLVSCIDSGEPEIVATRLVVDDVNVTGLPAVTVPVPAPDSTIEPGPVMLAVYWVAFETVMVCVAGANGEAARFVAAFSAIKPRFGVMRAVAGANWISVPVASLAVTPYPTEVRAVP